MSLISMKAAEIEGAIGICRLDQQEKQKQIEAHLVELHKAAERGGHWHKNEKLLAKHSHKAAQYAKTLDVLEGMCKLSVDGNISLDHEHFALLKPFIRTL